MNDKINPEHYKRLPAEAIEIIESAIDNAPSNQDAYLHGQALKYLLRCWHKNGIEDLKKAKWYLDRLVNSLDEYEQQKAADLQSLKDHPFGKLKTAHLNSDKIPEGYRKLGDPSKEPRQLGDLRWSVAEKRYIEISVDEIGYANRDNWTACRKIEPAIKQSLNTEPPDGWRWIEVGETLRRGDTTNTIDEIPEDWIGIKCAVKHNLLRRNRFEVGEKVVHVNDNPSIVYTVDGTRGDEAVIVSCRNIEYAISPNKLAPYIEETT